MSSGKLLGYIRVSSVDQNPDRQLEGVKLDKKFTDYISGKSIKRPQLEKLLEYAREGDEIVVHSMDRLARNLDDLRKLVKDLTSRDITLRFIKENLVFNGEDSPMSNLLLSIMGAFAEFERALIKERQMEGIVIAKEKGKFKGRKPKFTEAEAIQIRERVQKGERKSNIARDLDISRETLYRYLQQESKHKVSV